ncbi:hypothetical protein MKX01_040169 [Papaver californicum]|nr:hypothetical protein MKX01_040169 [Papaver californicum]
MDHAQNLFDQIPQPDIVIFNAMARGYALTKTPFRALTLFARVLELGLFPDDYTFPSIFKACANFKAFEEGKQVHNLVIKLGLYDNKYIHPTLINMYTECGDISAASKVFDKVPNPCVVTYNSMITGYSRCSQPNQALALFRKLQEYVYIHPCPLFLYKRSSAKFQGFPFSMR